MTEQVAITKTKDDINLKNIKYILLEHYRVCEHLDKYELELLTDKRRRMVVSKINTANNIVRNANRPVIVKDMKCWECGKPIQVHNPIVTNKRSTMKKRYYHFKCALAKELIYELPDNRMHPDYKLFIADKTI